MSIIITQPSAYHPDIHYSPGNFLLNQYIKLNNNRNTMEASRSTLKAFTPFKLEDTYSLTPDHPDFNKQPINLAILTKYGRGIYIRNGNEQRCSSFFATLGTIVNKLQMSFGRLEEGQEHPASLKCIRQGALKLYILRRLNYLYICWSVLPIHEISLYGMIEFVHHQLMSCLTGQVNTILETNQTYDPSINFGKTRPEHLLLHYAFTNGLHSLPIAFNALPTMPLPSATRNWLLNLFRQQKIDGLQISILMTLNQVISIQKQKGIELTCYDVFLFTTLIQSQSSLFKSEIWYPICLPGVEFDNRVFCYINFISEEVIHIMIADQANIFPLLSQASKKLKAKCLESGVLEKIHFSGRRDLINDPSLQRMTFVKHFVFRYIPTDESCLPQMIMGWGNYFGQNQKDFNKFIAYYSEMQHHLVTNKHGKREKVHIQPFGDLIGGYFEENSLTIFFICSGLCQLDECKGVLTSLAKFAKDQQPNLWIQKFV